ncbi:hypothetical protein ACVWWN_000587 [Mycobacterium sp. URHB0021]
MTDELGNRKTMRYDYLTGWLNSETKPPHLRPSTVTTASVAG